MIEPSEIEFLAEKKLVSIVPNFTFGEIHLISGKIGPFKAGLPVKVPIWLAVDLKKQQKCRILPQEWMDVEKLNEVKDIEKQSKLFTKMPSEHYMEEAQMILNAAPDDIVDVDDIRTSVKDLWDCRISKLRTSVIEFVQNAGTYAKLDHLTQMEMLSVRPLLPDALDVMQHIQETGKSSEQMSQQTQK